LASSYVKPLNASRLPWNSAAQASGRRVRAASVNEIWLLRLSAGSGTGVSKTWGSLLALGGLIGVAEA